MEAQKEIDQSRDPEQRLLLLILEKMLNRYQSTVPANNTEYMPFRPR
jgi:hypothetical protein